MARKKRGSDQPIGVGLTAKQMNLMPTQMVSILLLIVQQELEKHLLPYIMQFLMF